ncbi:MAG: hypothetical protein AAGD28_17190 [Bacteroidota bacterium]
MSSNKQLLFLLAVIPFVLLSFNSCNGIDKYEEGPFVSFIPAEDRAINDWRWSFYEENGINLSGIYEDSTLSIEENYTAKIVGADGGFREGSWEFISKKTKLQLIFDGIARAYTIEMLKNEEMWLSLNDTVEGFSQEWQLREK